MWYTGEGEPISDSVKQLSRGSNGRNQYFSEKKDINIVSLSKIRNSSIVYRTC
jgi:hypothetical protein